MRPTLQKPGPARNALVRPPAPAPPPGAGERLASERRRRVPRGYSGGRQETLKSALPVKSEYV
jgi:hypothetical protein